MSKWWLFREDEVEPLVCDFGAVLELIRVVMLSSSSGFRVLISLLFMIQCDLSVWAYFQYWFFGFCSRKLFMIRSEFALSSPNLDGWCVCCFPLRYLGPQFWLYIYIYMILEFNYHAYTISVRIVYVYHQSSFYLPFDYIYVALNLFAHAHAISSQIFFCFSGNFP